VATLVLPADHQAGATQAIAVPLDPQPAPQAASSAIDVAAERLRDASGAKPPVLFLGGHALGEAGLAAAGRIAAATGCRLISETFSARQERGRGVSAPERLPYLPEQANEALKDESLLILAGAKDPVAFFGYEGIPSVIAGHVARHCLASPEEDVVAALEALADALGAGSGTLPDASPPPARDQLPGGELGVGSLGTILASLLPENAIVVDEAATSGLAFSALSAGAARHTLLALTGGAIGQGLPCATGAAIACPDRRVIAFQADGSAMYTLQALWTQARESLDVTTVLCSNRAYRILQMELGRAGIFEPGPQARALTSLDQPSIDWVSLARGCGVPGERVDTCESFRDALGASLGEPGPTLIEALI
jgi:acetolactate synthase-1/2/3 large subunit